MEAPTIRVLSFKTEYELNRETGKRDVPVDYVEYAPVHAVMTTRIWERVKNLRPPEFIENDDDGKKLSFMRVRWAMIEPAYEAWKRGQELPMEGTPLAAWAGVTPEQAQAFHRAGIRTVEEVASLTDGVISKIHLPGVRDFVVQARAFLEAADRNVVADKLSAQQDEIDSLKEQLAAAMELLEETNKAKGGKAKAEKEAEVAV
ncbi:hypothetical protein [Brucella sp. IR073]|uniref:hypothetical protein n=1 Tax=unclassified Brucella TaxID=2632610 RepID=UPI003B986DCE